LKDKTVYLISYEEWGDMLMSKHHYAIELTRAGNTVYFINHPDLRKRERRGSVKVEPTRYERLFCVKNRLWTPYFIKYKYPGLFRWLSRFHIHRIVKAIGKKPDIVWSFDTGNTLPLAYFPGNPFRIYMPVDGPFGTRFEKEAVQDVDLLLSVTPEILAQYAHEAIPQQILNHGVAAVFFNEDPGMPVQEPVRIGYSGSLIRNDLDIDSFLAIVRGHPGKKFEFWGETNIQRSNIHRADDVSQRTREFIQTLRSLPNVTLHGAVPPEVLAAGLKEMDLLLVAYKIKKDQNHHKMLEYLATGKPVVSTYMSAYGRDYPGLIEMTGEHDPDDALVALFGKVAGNLAHYHSMEMQKKRIGFARQFSYSKQLERISGKMKELAEKKSKDNE